jgi:hypothetical protein
VSEDDKNAGALRRTGYIPGKDPNIQPSGDLHELLVRHIKAADALEAASE